MTPLARRWIVRLGVLLALTGVGLATWKFWPQPAVRTEIPFPTDIQDADVRQAIESGRARVVESPQSGEVWGEYGMVLLAHLFDREADRCFSEAARLDPGNPQWPYIRGVIAAKRDTENAPRLLRQAAETTGPDGTYNSVASLLLAEILLDRREFDEAKQLFATELKRNSNNTRAIYGLGLIALATGDDAEATQLLTRARSSAYCRKRATAQLAILARKRGDISDAAMLENEAAQLADDPAWPDPLLDRILRMRVGRRGRELEVGELERQGKFAEAAEEYLRQIELQPTSAAYVGAGVNLVRLGEYDRALPLLQEGIRLDPQSAQAHYTLALALFTRAEKAWYRTPNDPVIQSWFRETIEHAKRATELKADHAGAYLFWGLSLKYLGDLKGAIEPLRRGVVCRPIDFELQLALGEVLSEVGSAEEAETHLKNAQELKPADPRPAKALEKLRSRKK